MLGHENAHCLRIQTGLYFIIHVHATCDHVKVQACNELIIKSVDFLLKIFNIAITFEHVHICMYI